MASDTADLLRLELRKKHFSSPEAFDVAGEALRKPITVVRVWSGPSMDDPLGPGWTCIGIYVEGK